MLEKFSAKIERRAIVEHSDLMKERWSFAPVLGRDGWYKIVWYALVKLISADVLTQSGAWVIVTTWLAYDMTLRAFAVVGGLTENMKWLLYGFGGHTALAWLYWCARDQARNLLAAAADWIRGRTKPADIQRP